VTGRHVLVVRLDSMGDVLVCGPAVRAVAAHADRVSMLVGPRGAEAAWLLPGVDDVLVWGCPWIAYPPPPVEPRDFARLVERLRAAAIDEALVLTSLHQSALPTALLLQLAGIETVAAISEDYPGSLLSARLAPPPDGPEPLRMLAVAVAAGYPARSGEGAALRVRADRGVPDGLPGGPFVVVHPGADAAARSYPPDSWRAVVAALSRAGNRVIVTGAPDEITLTREVAQAGSPPGRVIDLGGRTDLRGLAAVLRRASVLAVANTGPAHLAAAVGTPVVCLFAPVVPARRWAPFGVPTVILGDQHAACSGTRARECPVPGHPCLAGVAPAEVVAAVDRLSAPHDCEIPA
jgi:ADP-heptose:LPS heptosyltransferase